MRTIKELEKALEDWESEETSKMISNLGITRTIAEIDRDAIIDILKVTLIQTKAFDKLIGDYFGKWIMTRKHIPGEVKTWCVTFESELKNLINCYDEDLKKEIMQKINGTGDGKCK